MDRSKIWLVGIGLILVPKCYTAPINREKNWKGEQLRINRPDARALHLVCPVNWHCVPLQYYFELPKVLCLYMHFR